MATDRSLKTKARYHDAKETVMLAHSFSPSKHVFSSPTKRQVDISNWLFYQKLDGVRAIFDGISIRSRTNRAFSVPNEFLDLTKQFAGDHLIDGELTHPLGFQTLVSIVRDQSDKVSMDFWKDVVYTVYDVRDPNKSFRERQDIILGKKGNQNIYPLLPVWHKTKTGKDLFSHAERLVQKHAWEGLIIRNPAGFYTFGRSHDLLKYKLFQNTEVEVTGYYPGEGKHENRIGGVWCTYNNHSFKCGTGFSDLERENPPPIGSMITIKYVDLTDQGVPKHATYVSIRNYE